MVKRLYIIGLFMLLVFIGCTGPDYSKEEIRCCIHCLDYGETNLSKNCLEVIEKFGGDRHCSLTMSEHPHTLFECSEIVK